MPIDPNELTRLRQNYVRVRGKACPTFFCPILLEHGEGPDGLMNGHILNEAITSAPRVTVIQRKDVDGHFGNSIEPSFIDFLNYRGMSAGEWLRKAGAAKSLKAIGASGKPYRAFLPAEKKKHQKGFDETFPSVELKDDAG